MKTLKSTTHNFIMKLRLCLAQLVVIVGTILLKHYDGCVLSNSWIVHKVAFVPPNGKTSINRRMNKSFHGSTTHDKLPVQHPQYYRSLGKSALQLSKKKAAPASVKKIQVKMLKYVEGTGHVGEIVMVTPAFFQNKLRPSSSAVMITDEEVTRAKLETAALEKETRVKAEALKERITDLSISIRRKAGPDGHLFGGIGPKCIMEELEKTINDDFLKQKSVKIMSVTNEVGSALDGDIKHTGVYKASLSLTKDISGLFDITVEAER